MMLRRVFIVLCLAYIVKSCIPYTVIDPQLSKYDTDYLNIVKQYCGSTKYFHPLQKTIYFQEMENNHIAYCARNRFTKLNIVVNSKYWKDSSEDMKYSTLVHELTHCYFRVGHSENKHHFMYSFENFLTREEVDTQLIEFLKEQCK